MSKRKYRIRGKSFDFNNVKFKSLIENFAKVNKISKRKVYMMLTERLGLAFDSYKTIEKWASTDVGPSNEQYFEDIAIFFNVSYFDFLDEIEVKKEISMNNINYNKELKTKENSAAKKFNEIQIQEFMRIKNFVLDYLYTYYSPYMNDMWEQEKIEDDFGYNLLDSISTNDIAERMLGEKSHIDAKNYFSTEELAEIKLAVENQERYHELNNSAGIEFQCRKYGDTSEKYQGVSIDEQKFLRENRIRMNLLKDYEGIEKFGYRILIRQEIDKTLSLLPYEVYNKLLRLVDLIPSPNWKEEYGLDWVIDDNCNYDLNKVVDIDKYESEKIKDRGAMTSLEKSKMLFEREKEIEEAKLSILSSDKNDEDALVYSINNRIMNVHKIFFDIMNEYIS